MSNTVPYCEAWSKAGLPPRLFKRSCGISYVMRTPPLLQRALTGLLLLVLGYSLFYACAFVQIYRAPHSYKAASQWIFENVPAGSMLLGPHWDDRLPVGLPGFNPHQYTYECSECDLPFYERDTPGSIEVLLSRMVKGDYIVFPTPRIQGSIPRIPEEYPRTTALLQLLWGEKLGYQLVTTLKATPELYGISFNDDVADESFSVYDHPKVTIFKNVERLSLGEMRGRVFNSDAYAPLPTLREILQTDTRVDVAQFGTTSPGRFLLEGFLPICLLILLGILLTGCIAGRGNPFKDGALGFTSIGSLMLIGAGSGVCAIVTHSPEETPLLRVATLLLFVGILMCLPGCRSKRSAGKSFLIVCSAVAMVFAGILALLLCSVLGIEESIRADAVGAWESIFFLRRSASLAALRETPLGILPAAVIWIFLIPLKVLSTSIVHVVPHLTGLLSAVITGIVFSSLSLAVRSGKILAMVGILLGLLCNPILMLRFVGGNVGGDVIAYDGTGYEKVVRRAVAWANISVEGTPKVLEAPIDSAGKEVLFAPQAGLQSVSRLQMTQESVNENGREFSHSLLDEMYTANDVMRTFSLLRDNGIGLVVVGPREVERYGDSIRRKFEIHKELFSEAFTYEDLKIFAPASSPFFVPNVKREEFFIPTR